MEQFAYEKFYKKFYLITKENKKLFFEDVSQLSREEWEATNPVGKEKQYRRYPSDPVVEVACALLHKINTQTVHAEFFYLCLSEQEEEIFICNNEEAEEDVYKTFQAFSFPPLLDLLVNGLRKEATETDKSLITHMHSFILFRSIVNHFQLLKGTS